jgi:hypothetical protein
MYVTPLAPNRPAPSTFRTPTPAARPADTQQRFETELVLSFKKPVETDPTLSVEGAGPERRVTSLRKLFSF